ncbi:MAG: hypothetical protein RI949_277 [Pseudomonadota bacterium]|jgi:hypothetical protein
MPYPNEVRGSTAQERAQNVLGAVKTIESIADKQKAALHQTFTFQFEMSDLGRRIVNPTFSQTPQTRVRFEPDWGQIAQLREQGVLSFSLT